jgi:hypothetical protein
VDLARSDENGDYGVRQLSKGTVAQLLSGARDGEKGMGSSSPRGRGRRRGVEGPGGAPHGDAKGGGVRWLAIHATDGDGWCRAGCGKGLNRAVDR